MYHLDLPTTAELADLATQRNDPSVSIFLPTTPVTANTDADRIELKNLARQAIDQLEAAHADKRHVRALAEAFDDLVDDDEFWRFQARGLAIYATPQNLRTFRVPNALVPLVVVSDRFHLKPLLRATTFPYSCHVLALAAGGVRLVEVSSDLPAVTVKVDGLPHAVAAASKASAGDRTHTGRMVGAEGQTIRLRAYARKVDAALRKTFAGSHLPLVLAAPEPIGPIFRSVNSYPHLLATGIDGNPERQTDAELAAAGRAVLDSFYRDQLAAWRALFGQRGSEGRATTDIAKAARAATFGGVESLLVDMDEMVHGTVDEADGTVRFADKASAATYGVVDEIARRALLSGGKVMSVRKADIPDGKPLAAILRYAL